MKTYRVEVFGKNARTLYFDTAKEATDYAKENCMDEDSFLLKHIIDDKYDVVSRLTRKMNFRKYLKEAIKNEHEFDAIIGGTEMPATFCLSDETEITSYCEEKYGKLLDSPIIEHSTNVIEVLFDDWKLGREFAYAMAGYVSEKEFEALFGW